MQQIGEELRTARLAKGVELASIQEEAKIGRHYLEAMEAGAFDRLPPGDPYVKGFIRSYARVLELDSTALIQRLEQVRASEVVETPVEPRRNTGFLQRINQTLQWLGF